jgi:Alpha/beta hydrolase family
MTTRETPVLLLHGYWHGAWCWSEVLARLTAAGTRALAVDMAGHGLRARRPAAPTVRPFDPAALAAEPSPAVADLDEAAGLFAAGATTLTAAGWGSVPHTYVVCTRDRALQPTMQRKFIELADAAFPDNPTTVHTLDSSHSPFLSMPGELADIILKLCPSESSR